MIIFCRENLIKKNKSYCFQISYWGIFLETFIFNITLFQRDYWYLCNINLFGLFEFRLEHTKKRDHAGFMFYINVFGFDIHLDIYDIRHWDNLNEKWKIYEKN